MTRDPKTKQTSTLHAGVLSVAMSDVSGILGSLATFTPPPLPSPVIRHEPWPWANPAAAVLRFLGWTARDLLDEPERAQKFWTIIQILRSCEVQRAERERELFRRETHWWRQQGCPVPCPECGAEETCSCRASRGADRP